MQPIYVLIGALVVAQFMFLMLISSRLRRLEGRLNTVLAHLGAPSPELPAEHRLPGGPPTLLPSERVRMLARDPARKIEAIKVYREETGVGLKEAKDAIERLQRQW